MIRDKTICATRAAWYGLTEPVGVRLGRLRWDASADPLVSIYIPTFNRVDLLMKRAIPSVLAQTYTNWELVVAAHGCTDGTADAVWGIGDRRVRLIEVPRKRTYPSTAITHWLVGPVVPANAALRRLRGNWIARLDDDDTWAPDHLVRLLSFAWRGNYEFVSSAHDTPAGKVKPYEIDGAIIGGTQTWVYRSYLRFMRYNPDCWRKSWNKNNDIDLQNRFVRAGVRIGYLDEVTCHIYPRPGDTEIGSKAYLADEKRTERRFAF